MFEFQIWDVFLPQNSLPCWLVCRIQQQYHGRWVSFPPHTHTHSVGTPVCYGWQPVMLEARILVAKRSMTRQPNWSHDLQYSTLALTKKDKQLEWPNPINQLAMSSSSTCMIVQTVFFKLLLWQTSIQPYFILKVLEGSGWGSVLLRKPRHWPLFNFN